MIPEHFQFVKGSRVHCSLIVEMLLALPMALGTRVELVMQEWKSWVLTAWPTEHISSLLPLSSTVGCCLAAGRLSEFHWANRVLELTFWWARLVPPQLLPKKTGLQPAAFADSLLTHNVCANFLYFIARPSSRTAHTKFKDGAGGGGGCRPHSSYFYDLTV